MGRKNDGERKTGSLLAFGFPVFEKESRLDISGSREIIAEGCAGVVLYSETMIRLSMGRQSVVITGCGLSITNMFGQTVCVSGKISSVEFI